MDEGESCDDGNTVGGDGCSAVCTSEVPVHARALIITEVMANPSEVSDSDGEWFEVHNTTETPLNLGGWEIHDGNGLAFVIPATEMANVEPGAYRVLGISDDLESNGGVGVNYAYGNALSLSNSGDQIDVVWAGEVVDSFVYEPEGFVIESGISLQLGSESLSATANDSSESWCSSRRPRRTSTRAPRKLWFWWERWDGKPNRGGCDDGNDLDGDGCETTCTDTSECGNGLVREGEECDDGNEIDGDGCETDCTFTPPECGNGVPEGTEACDDGNEVDGDGCETDCTLTIVLPGQILISEFMANPSGVADSQGEWLELWNGASISVNLEGWTLRDLGSMST